MNKYIQLSWETRHSQRDRPGYFTTDYMMFSNYKKNYNNNNNNNNIGGLSSIPLNNLIAANSFRVPFVFCCCRCSSVLLARSHLYKIFIAGQQATTLLDNKKKQRKTYETFNVAEQEIEMKKKHKHTHKPALALWVLSKNSRAHNHYDRQCASSGDYDFSLFPIPMNKT